MKVFDFEAKLRFIFLFDLLNHFFDDPIKQLNVVSADPLVDLV